MTRRLSTSVLAIAMAALFGQPEQGSAQARRGDMHRTRAGDEASATGRGFFNVGYMGLDADELNAALAEGDLPSLDGSFLTLGGGGYGARGRFLIGGEGHGLLGSDETSADGSMHVSVHGGYGLFRIGYLAASHGGLDVFPSVGIGGGGMSVKISERSAPTFGDVIEEPRRSSTLSSGSLLLDVGAAAHLRVAGERETRDDRDGGFLVGIHAGYTFAPGDSSWDLDGINSVAGGPNFQIQGAYVRLSIGGWGRRGR